MRLLKRLKKLALCLDEYGLYGVYIGVSLGPRLSGSGLQRLGFRI